jgi:hypothetical protein
MFRNGALVDPRVILEFVDSIGSRIDVRMSSGRLDSDVGIDRFAHDTKGM